MTSTSPKLSFEQCKTLLGVSAETPMNRGSSLRLDDEDIEEIGFEINGLEVAGIGYDAHGEVTGWVFNPYPQTKSVEVVFNWILKFSKPNLSHMVSHLLNQEEVRGDQEKKMFFGGWYIKLRVADLVLNFNQYGLWGWSTYGWFVVFAGDFIEPVFKGDNSRCLVSFETLLDYFLSRGYVLVNE